jgi:hypothetical protein
MLHDSPAGTPARAFRLRHVARKTVDRLYIAFA